MIYDKERSKSNWFENFKSKYISNPNMFMYDWFITVVIVVINMASYQHTAQPISMYVISPIFFTVLLHSFELVSEFYNAVLAHP